ncbi:MAG: hypothetical protein ACE14T_07680 [Syntrophales bacterium]
MDPGVHGKSEDVRFINRVFTWNERSGIRNSRRPDELLWSFWAGKETAYKISRKSGERLVFSPRAYEVHFAGEGCPGDGDGDFLSGTVAGPRGTAWIRLFWTGEYIHCIGADSPGALDHVIMGVRRIESGDDESFMARRTAAERLAILFHAGPGGIEVVKTDANPGSPPAIGFRGRTADIDISLSHDYPFVAYALDGLPFVEGCHDLSP